jgi:hypothetical protein
MSPWVFQPSPWAAVLVALCALLLGLAVWREWGRGADAVSWLGRACHALGVALLALMAMRPERTMQAPGRTHAAITEDRTGSMATPDADANGRDRASVARRVIAELRARLEADATVVSLGSTEPAADPAAGTDLHAALTTALAQRPATVVLVSDGAWNAGRDPREAACDAAAMGIPIFTVCIGSRDPATGLRLSGMSVPPHCLTGDLVLVSARVENMLPEPWSGEVVLAQAGTVVATQEVTVPARERRWVALRWRPHLAGLATLRLALPVLPADRLAADNAGSADILVEDARLRLLWVDEQPRWEFRHAVAALRGDRGIAVRTLLLDPSRRRDEPLPPDLRSEDVAAQDSNSDRLDEFPSRTALADYDAVVLGAVRFGSTPDAGLPAQAAEDLRRAVEEDGTGLILVPGAGAGPAAWAASPLVSLLPVRPPTPADDGLRRLRTGFQPQRTPAGLASTLLAFADSPEGDADAWRELPALRRYTRCGQALPGSTVLAALPDDSREDPSLPLWVRQRAGRGRILYLGTDDLWRWRQSGKGLAYERFWRAAVRAVTRRTPPTSDADWRLLIDPDPAVVGLPVEISAVPRADSAEQAIPRLSCTLQSAQGTTLLLALAPEQRGGRVLTARARLPEAGLWQILREGSDVPAATLNVLPAAAESATLPARPEVLDSVSRVSGGTCFAPDDYEAMARAVSGRLGTAAGASRSRPWTHPALAGAVCLLLSAGWLLLGRRT